MDLRFPEFTRYLKDLNTALATAILAALPHRPSLRGLSRKRLAKLSYDGRHHVDAEHAQQLIDAAAISVGSQHSPGHQLDVRYVCEDLETLRKRLKRLDGDVAGTLQRHQVGQLLTTIGGIGETTAAMLIAELGDPACFASAAALTAYVGLFAGHKHSGKSQPKNSSLSPLGSRRVRRALWMPTSSAATQSNPWLMVFYRRLQLHAFLDDMDHLVFLSKHCAGLTRGCVCAMDIEWPV